MVVSAPPAPSAIRKEALRRSEPEPAAASPIDWRILPLPPEVVDILSRSPRVIVARSRAELMDLACGGPESQSCTVDYELPDGSRVIEATVVRTRNGAVANSPDPYMRRRDPDTMVIADDQPTDKMTYVKRFGEPFAPMRQKTLDWLAGQELAVLAFQAGQPGMGLDAIAIVPANACFFVLALAMLQGMLDPLNLPPGFNPRAALYVAPVFRHTQFKGKQVVVHNRREDMHEMFAYNLYPGPSAKKGIYGVLIGLGEREGWITAHCSTVRVVTPYDNELVFMHEGASGGGKSEMLEYPHRMSDGRLHLGRNLVTGEDRYLEIARGCKLEPVTDDMALCHASLQTGDGKLTVTDAEDAWFVRVNHITEYGTDLDLEKLTAQPPEPLLFLNIDSVPGGRAMIWEHTMDAPGKPCPNPRVILPRGIVPGIVNEPVKVDIRSFGVRTPPCTRENPTYGILGLFHVLPPALAWLWRLVAPRGHANPSVVDTDGMSSEGVGSYWPFATGRRVDQANLLLRQIVAGTRVRHILTPNQHVGAWETGFMPQWLTREYLARRGAARFKEGQVEPARCPLLGHALFQMQIEGRSIPRWFLQVNTQPEVGNEGYDAGAEILYEFFRKQLSKFLHPDLDALGFEIIKCCLSKGDVKDYEGFIETK